MSKRPKARILAAFGYTERGFERLTSEYPLAHSGHMLREGPIGYRVCEVFRIAD